MKNGRPGLEQRQPKGESCTMLTDIEIARAAKLEPIARISAKAGIPEEALIPYGRY